MPPPVFTPDVFIDFHTHKARYEHRADVLEIISSHLGDDKTGDLYTLGSHPWLTPEQLTEEQLRVLSKAHCCTIPAALLWASAGWISSKAPT
jgi:hypothetical protein